MLRALELSFPGPRVFGEDDRQFLLLLLATEGAQAIERVQLVAALSRRAPVAGLGAALSTRERDVLVLVVDGLTNREIADQLGLGVDTVKTHVDHICEKLAVAGSSRSRVLAVARAVQLGLVPVESVRQPPAVLSPHRAARAPGFHGAADPA